MHKFQTCLPAGKVSNFKYLIKQFDPLRAFIFSRRPLHTACSLQLTIFSLPSRFALNSVLPNLHVSSLSSFLAFPFSRLSRCLLLTACCLVLTFFSSGAASAGVTVFDTVAMVNEPVKFKALTKGRFFPEGGKLVTFHVDGRNIGTTLSGGDGYAFMKYKSSSRGVKVLKVESGDSTDEGALLITGSKDKVILIAIESALFDSMLSFKPSEKGRDALNKLSKKFKIIYVSTLIGMKQSRNWLHEHEFPSSSVLKWEGAELIDDLQGKHIPLHAIIGSPDVLTDAPGIEKRFSFIETEDGREVKDWDALIDKLE